MHNTILKKVFSFLSILSILSLVACDLSVTVALPTITMIPASVTPIVATTAPTQVPASATLVPATVASNSTPSALQPSFDGVEVSVGPLSVVLPPGVTYGSRGIEFPRAEGENVAPWEVTPGHVQLKLEGYLLQGKFHQPQIYVYPAQPYAEMFPAAFESIRRLDNIHGSPGAPISDEQLPTVPFFNARQVFASNIQEISFQNGWGVRFLTEYAQYAASANNHDLFYHFQGLTSDGLYYVIAILPISNPFLAETSDGGAALPPEGIPYPYFADPNADMTNYYKSVTDVLNATPPQSFAPTINQLDSLIQSMRIAP